MRASDKNIMVWAEKCGSEECIDNCENVCATCRHCLSQKMRQNVMRAVNEHLNRNDCKRIYPPSMVRK